MDARSPALALPLERHNAGSAALAERLLNFVLFITVLTSAIAFIEPSPHDALMFVLLSTCVTARVRFDRKLIPLLVLMILWLVGGAMSLTQVGDDAKAIQYFGTSVYLGIAVVMFACLFSDGNPVRLSILRRAYILAALYATLAGYIGFFHLLPHSDIFLAYSEDGGVVGRVSATFKDPNVYGPFLIYPLLLLVIGFLTRGVTLLGLVTIAFLLGGLFLSFSRGAWFHFGLSAVIAIATLYVASPNPRMRTRIVIFSVAGAFAVALLLIALTSIDSVHELLLVRAKAIQPYDVGSNGRFSLQELAIGAILDHPNGMGPDQFGIVFGGQQHNVYMECFLVYGWLGGATYLAIVALTFMIGLRNMLMPTPWQGYLIAAYAAFVGEAAESFIIDSDHWRHFFLIVGLVWGLSVATINWRRRQAFGIGAGAATLSA
jgi:O-antigen ligase/polysaccharide polymerase Wzy-like membrane protein